MTLDRLIGTVLGGYRIEESLGRGGTSVVYRAEHVRLGRRAALKLLAPGLGEADFTERFLRESRLAASLDHPNIVPVYDAGEQDGLLYIAMACVDGSDLKSLLAEEHQLPLRRALRIVGQIASALDAAHARGLVHRDVKPANILVGDGDRAYLSDFGIVKEVARNGTTRTGSFVGTIDYCAPEQIEGREVDARTDVYALACVLYECLAGEPPFHRESEVAVLNAHLHAPPPKLLRAAPDLPVGLEQVVAKALSKSPLDRYASCGEFMAAARGAAAERRVHGRRLMISLALLLVSALVGAGVALGIRSLVTGGTQHASAQPPPAQPGLGQVLLRSKDGQTLGNIAYALIVQHHYADAIPFARKAMRVAPAGTLTLTYATYNLGVALFHVGRCAESLTILRKALLLESASQRPVVQREITRAQACVPGGASARAR
jgi:tRNA A-37 threonylcarbamoyl transferase component Bud32